MDRSLLGRSAMSRCLTAAAVALPILFAALPALADDAMPDPAASIIYPMLGPDGLRTSFDFRAGTVAFDDGYEVSRLELRGQYLAPTGVGGYARLAVSASAGTSAVGSPELGVLAHRARGDGDLTLRAGLVIPAGTNDEGTKSHYLGTLAVRPSDHLAAFPDIVILRLALAPALRRDDLFVRADLGADVMLDTGHDDRGTLIHLDVGAGVRSGQLGLVAELGNTVMLTSDRMTLHTAALTGEWFGNSLGCSVTVSRTFGSDFADEYPATAILAGLHGPM
jgi:hypothetical protein